MKESMEEAVVVEAVVVFIDKNDTCNARPSNYMVVIFITQSVNVHADDCLDLRRRIDINSGVSIACLYL